MEIIKLEKLKNKSPFTHILSDDIKYKVLPHLELVPNNQVKDTYEELIGSNNALYIMGIIFLIIFEGALFFTINKLELIIVSIIVVALLAYIILKLIQSIQTINNIEIRYNTLSVAEIKDTKKESDKFIKIEDKINNYLIDGWIEVDKKYNVGDEIVLYVIYTDRFISITCKDTNNNLQIVQEEQPDIQPQVQEEKQVEVKEEPQVEEKQVEVKEDPQVQEEKPKPKEKNKYEDEEII